MTSSCDPSLPLFSQQPGQGWALTALIVIAIHFGAIAFGLYYSPAEPQLKKKAKVVVQTVQLHSEQRVQVTKPAPSRSLPEAGTKKQNEKAAAAPEASPAKPIAPPQPEQKEAKKTEVKKSVQKPEVPPVVKQTAAPAKPTPSNVAKSKAPAQPQKKQADDKAELDKKKQQEKAEAEKKKQQQEKAKRSLPSGGVRCLPAALEVE
jgi:FtsZ-interacting cell division protein ZipA